MGSDTKTSFLSRQAGSAKLLSSGEGRGAGALTNDDRLDMVIEAARASGFTVDAVYGVSANLDDISFRQLIGRLSTSPMYMYSNVIPYRRRNSKAPSKPIR